MTALTTLRYMTADDWSYYVDLALWWIRFAWYSSLPWLTWGGMLAAQLYLPGFWYMDQGRKMLLNAVEQGGWNETAD